MYFFIFTLFRIFLLANSEDPDQMPRSAASDLGLHCLPMTQKWDVGLYGLNFIGKTCFKEKTYHIRYVWFLIPFSSFWVQSFFNKKKGMGAGCLGLLLFSIHGVILWLSQTFRNRYLDMIQVSSGITAGPATSVGRDIRLVFRRLLVWSTGPAPSFVEIW